MVAVVSCLRLVLLSCKSPRRYGSFFLLRRGCSLVAVEIPPAGERGVDLHDGTGTQARFHAYATDLVHLVGIGDSVGAAPANRVAFATVAPKTWSRRKSAIGVNRAAMRSILST